jgi:hypothetical protein
METRVYKNLNNGKWSLKQRDSVTGKFVVVGHCDSLAMNSVTPTVSDARHNHVRQGNHREVFAWLNGDLCWVNRFVPFKGREVRTADAFPNRPFNRTTKVSFHPFAEVKRGFFWCEEFSPAYDSDFLYASCAYFTADSGVWAV